MAIAPRSAAPGFRGYGDPAMNQQITDVLANAMYRTTGSRLRKTLRTNELRLSPAENRMNARTTALETYQAGLPGVIAETTRIGKQFGSARGLLQEYKKSNKTQEDLLNAAWAAAPLAWKATHTRLDLLTPEGRQAYEQFQQGFANARTDWKIGRQQWQAQQRAQRAAYAGQQRYVTAVKQAQKRYGVLYDRYQAAHDAYERYANRA
jgi:hypothetical protein